MKLIMIFRVLFFYHHIDNPDFYIPRPEETVNPVNNEKKLELGTSLRNLQGGLKKLLLKTKESIVFLDHPVLIYHSFY